MKVTGTSSDMNRSRSTRPNRFCSSKKLSGLPSRQATISPSSTNSAGTPAAAAAISGKVFAIGFKSRE